MNIDSDGASIEDVLSNVLADTGFTFRIKDRTIIIIPSDRTRNQRSVISGRVFSAADGLPVPGVSVYVEGTMSGTFTDADGNEDGNGENEGDEGDEQEPAAELSIEKQWVADLSEEQDGSTRKCFGRRGRPWPREREGPISQIWEGFTGPNIYGLSI